MDYNEEEEEEHKAVLEVLDADFPVDKSGLLSAEARIKMAPLLKNESTYEILASYIVTPPNPPPQIPQLSSPDEIRIKRSYRAMSILSNDCDTASQIVRRGGNVDDDSGNKQHLLLNSVKAGLLAKQLFVAYELSAGNMTQKSNGASPKKKKAGVNDDACQTTTATTTTKCPPHAPHINYLLQSLLDAHPSPVISAACAGGKDGVSEHFGPMLASSRKCHSRFMDNHDDDDDREEENNDDDLFLAMSSPLPVLSSLVTRGCTGRNMDNGNGGGVAAANQQAFAGQMGAAAGGKNDVVLISKGHRRKFVRSLADWGVFMHLAECITLSKKDQEENRCKQISASELFHSEASCDALLSIVDDIGYPPAAPTPTALTPKQQKVTEEESVGEETLLSTLANESFLHLLASHAATNSTPSTTTATTSETSSRALLGLFELATGRSKQKDKTLPPPTEDTLEDESKEEHDRAERIAASLLARRPKDNKLRKAGVTAKMHGCLVGLLDMIVAGIMMDRAPPPTTTAVVEGEDKCGGAAMIPEDESVRHPGRYIVQKPFTSRRLNLVTLLADLLSYEDEEEEENGGTDGAVVASNKKVDASLKRPHRNEAAVSAMDKLMELPLPASLEKKKNKKTKKNASATNETSSEETKKEEEDGATKDSDAKKVENPWPGLVDLLFDYPENNMYQIQFYRLMHAVCAANHEPTLKVLVQKTKFVGRAIDACQPPPDADNPSSSTEGGRSFPSNHGVLLRCLNALRLRSQSLPPQSFLYHYLDSHDKWKEFEDTLKRITIEQQIPGGGIAVPNINGETNSATSPDAQGSDIDIDLGSVFATELGFSASVYKRYVKGEDNENTVMAESTEDGTKSGGGGGGKKKKGKKKKKKKKKKKNTGDASDQASSHETDGEETEDCDEDDDHDHDD